MLAYIDEVYYLLRVWTTQIVIFGSSCCILSS